MTFLIRHQWNCSPFKAMLRLAQASNGTALMLFHAYSGEPGNEKPLENADLVIFDPRTIADTPPENNGPFRKPKGIHHVFISDIHVVRNGRYINAERAGRIL